VSALQVAFGQCAREPQRYRASVATRPSASRAKSRERCVPLPARNVRAEVAGSIAERHNTSCATVYCVAVRDVRQHGEVRRPVLLTLLPGCTHWLCRANSGGRRTPMVRGYASSPAVPGRRTPAPDDFRNFSEIGGPHVIGDRLTVWGDHPVAGGPWSQVIHLVPSSLNTTVFSPIRILECDRPSCVTSYVEGGGKVHMRSESSWPGGVAFTAEAPAHSLDRPSASR